MNWVDLENDSKPAKIVRPFVYSFIRESSNAFLIENRNNVKIKYTKDYFGNVIGGIDYEFKKH